MYQEISNAIKTAIQEGARFQRSSTISSKDNDALEDLIEKFNKLKQQYDDFSGTKIPGAIVQVQALLKEIKANGPESADFLQKVFLPVCTAMLNFCKEYVKSNLKFKEKIAKMAIEKVIGIEFDQLTAEMLGVYKNLQKNIKVYRDTSLFWKKAERVDSTFKLAGFGATERFLILLELIKNKPDEKNFFVMMDPEKSLGQPSASSKELFFNEISFLNPNTLKILRRVIEDEKVLDTRLSDFILKTFEENEKELVELCGEEFAEAKMMTSHINKINV